MPDIHPAQEESAVLYSPCSPSAPSMSTTIGTVYNPAVQAPSFFRWLEGVLLFMNPTVVHGVTQ